MDLVCLDKDEEYCQSYLTRLGIPGRVRISQEYKIQNYLRGGTPVLVTGESTIGQVIMAKGTAAGELMDAALCDCERACCPGTTLALSFAAQRKQKEHLLPDLLKKLNEIPDIDHRS